MYRVDESAARYQVRAPDDWWIADCGAGDHARENAEQIVAALNERRAAVAERLSLLERFFLLHRKHDEADLEWLRSMDHGTDAQTQACLIHREETCGEIEHVREQLEERFYPPPADPPRPPMNEAGKAALGEIIRAAQEHLGKGGDAL